MTPTAYNAPSGPPPHFPQRPTLAVVAVLVFLASIVGANLAVNHFGEAALPFTAFLLIPGDLLARDVLHEQWEGEGGRLSMGLTVKMLLLVMAGAVVTLAVTTSAWHVARASVAAFTCATAVNTLAYWAARSWPDAWRMNTSNLLAAASDSLVFPLVAFAHVTPWIAATQTAAKFVGGLVWVALYLYARRRFTKNGSR